MSEEKNMQETAIENCTHDCSTCSANCASRDPGSLLECNRVLKRGYDREEVVSQWKRSLP